MKPILITIILIFLFVVAKAQTKVKQPDTVMLYADDWYTQPSYPGGIKQFYKYLLKNIHYPANALKNHAQGKVYLNFVIEKNGKVDSIKVTRGVSVDIDAEAIRVLRTSPKWIPGTRHDKPIPYHYSMPLNFQIPKTNKAKR
ncbi:MAG: energy transducer TonB [Bacteroidetes bacterium]|nr:energy transducer TonB [Bacteroidota bacterium]